MQTVFLFGRDYETPAQVHESLKSMLGLPSWYGMNADALNDCLSEMPSCPALRIRPDGPEEVVSCLRLVSRVFRDNGADVKEF